MGIIYWVVYVFIVFLIIKLAFYIYKSRIDRLPKSSKLLKYIHQVKSITECLYNYLAVNQVVSLTSLVFYLWYEYYEKGCFDLKCFVSDKKISATKLVKLDVVATIILIIGLLVHFYRILVLVSLRKWFGFQSELNQSRISYVQEH